MTEKKEGLILGRRFEITRGALWFGVLVLILNLVIGGANLWASFEINSDSISRSQSQGKAIEHSLCTTLDRLSALKPPAGDASQNPSRAYEQEQHQILSELGPDVGCSK